MFINYFIIATIVIRNVIRYKKRFFIWRVILEEMYLMPYPKRIGGDKFVWLYGVIFKLISEIEK